MNVALRRAALLCLATSAAQAQAPAFREGIWEYERTSGANKYVAKECVNPSRDMRQEDGVLDKMGCKRSSAQQGASVYVSTAECTVKLPSGFASWTTTSTLTVQSDSAYTLQTRTIRSGQAIEETTTARRVADCAK